MQGAQILKMRRTYGYAVMIYPVESCEAGPQSGIQPGRGCSATQQMDFLRSHQLLLIYLGICGKVSKIKIVQVHPKI